MTFLKGYLVTFVKYLKISMPSDPVLETSLWRNNPSVDKDRFVTELFIKKENCNNNNNKNIIHK